MPIYEYRCRSCGHTRDELRSPERADAPSACDCGHHDSVRLPSLVARSRSGSGGELPMAGGAAAGGGCCGGGCCG